MWASLSPASRRASRSLSASVQACRGRQSLLWRAEALHQSHVATSEPRSRSGPAANTASWGRARHGCRTRSTASPRSRPACPIRPRRHDGLLAVACWATKIGCPRIGVCRPSFFWSASASRSTTNGLPCSSTTANEWQIEVGRELRLRDCSTSCVAVPLGPCYHLAGAIPR